MVASEAAAGINEKGMLGFYSAACDPMSVLNQYALVRGVNCE